MLVVLFFLIGVILGSFVNALVWRLRERRNWVSERSECVHCHHKLSEADLVPIMSWLALKGRCRYCKKPISVQYPIVEFASGVLFAVSYVWWPYEFTSVGIVRLGFWLVALVVLTALFIYDLKWLKFPVLLLRALVVLGVVQTIFVVALSPAVERIDVAMAAFLASVVGGGLFLLIYWFSKGQAIGDGDSHLGFGFGLLLGAPLLSWMAITFASIIGSVFAIILIAKGKSRKSKVPFGPFLITGVVISMLFGQKIWDYIGVLLVP